MCNISKVTEIPFIIVFAKKALWLLVVSAQRREMLKRNRGTLSRIDRAMDVRGKKCLHSGKEMGQSWNPGGWCRSFLKDDGGAADWKRYRALNMGYKWDHVSRWCIASPKFQMLCFPVVTYCFCTFHSTIVNIHLFHLIKAATADQAISSFQAPFCGPHILPSLILTTATWHTLCYSFHSRWENWGTETLISSQGPQLKVVCNRD